jgi:hypothetical protein
MGVMVELMDIRVPPEMHDDVTPAEIADALLN